MLSQKYRRGVATVQKRSGFIPIGWYVRGLSEEVPCELSLEGALAYGWWRRRKKAHGNKRTEISKVVGLGSRESSDPVEEVQM